MTDRSILLCLMRRSTQHGALWMRLALRLWNQRKSMWHIFTFRPRKALWTSSRSLGLTKFKLDPIWEQIKIDLILLFEWDCFLLLISLAIVNYCRLLNYKILMIIIISISLLARKNVLAVIIVRKLIIIKFLIIFFTKLSTFLRFFFKIKQYYFALLGLLIF